MDTQSEVAKLRQKIALECQASWSALHALNAGTAQHTFIAARFQNMGAHHQRLAELVGEEQATEHLCEVWDEQASDGAATKRDRGGVMGDHADHAEHQREAATPEIFKEWKRRAEIGETFESEWGDYHTLLTLYYAALQRAPRTATECDGVVIENLLISELEHLANVVSTIFSRGGFMEFASYATKPPSTNHQS